MTRALRNACAAAVFMGLALSTPTARADESAAETLFQEGLAAMKRNDFNVACEAFTKSNKADPSPGTQINLAICFEKQKKWASAWAWYRSAAGLAQQRQQGAREQSANEAATRLKPQLHYVLINVKDPPPDMVVKRDGVEVVTQLAGSPVPLPIDPGDHTIEITATAKKPFTKSISVLDNPNTDKVDVTLEAAPVEQTPPPTNGAPPAPYTVTVQGNDGSSQRTVGFIVGGAGILAGIASVGVFVLANNEASQRDAQKKIATDPTKTDAQRTAATSSQNSHNSAANNDQLIAIVLGISAGVMIAGGAVLYLTAPKPKPTTGLVVRPVPIATPTWQGLGLTGTF